MLLNWLSNWWQQFRREMSVPAPPFRASKRTAVIMYGLWYGRLTKDEARIKAAEWGFDSDAIEQMIGEATQPPAWSQH
jgi:hypothetical protein